MGRQLWAGMPGASSGRGRCLGAALTAYADRAMDPVTPQFWAVMSIGVTVGFVVAYPVNVWMVAHHLKHGLMTARHTPATPAAIPPSVPRLPAEALS